jgi:hypothetical protein
MTLSGASAAVAGLVWGLHPALVMAVMLFWGFWVVADSAQFSTLVTEVADQRYVGTGLTLQLALGFTFTAVTIWLIPLLVDLRSAGAGRSWCSCQAPCSGTLAMRLLARELGETTTQAAHAP